MWKALHQLAIPERLYRLCGCWIPWLAALSALLLVIGLGWGFGFAPADYQQGESYRIMYLHVPAAMWSMGLYLAMAVAAFVGVVWQIKMADLAIAALAPVGAVCTLVALVSGAAWGKPMWGTWWIWDARLTSELVLLFLYAGVIALWHAFDDRRLAGRAAAHQHLILAPVAARQDQGGRVLRSLASADARRVTAAGVRGVAEQAGGYGRLRAPDHRALA